MSLGIAPLSSVLRDDPMPNYRRNRIPGGTYFFTVNLRDRISDLLVAGIEALRGSVRATRARHPFHIDAWVVLPDHLNCLWTLPTGDVGFPVRWQTNRVNPRIEAPGSKPPDPSPRPKPRVEEPGGRGPGARRGRAQPPLPTVMAGLVPAIHPFTHSLYRHGRA